MRFFLVIVIFAIVSPAYTQQPWVFDVTASATAQHTYHSDNWEGSSQDALTWTCKSKSRARKALSSLVKNKNTLQLSFGQTMTKDKDTSWTQPQKSLDLIQFESLFSFTLDAWAEPFTALKMESQFVDNRTSTTTWHLNPVTIRETGGASRHFISGDKLSLTSRLGGTLNHDIDRNTYVSEATGESYDITHDAGIETTLLIDASHSDEVVVYTTKLNIYQALLSSESDTPDSAGIAKWRYPRMDWQHSCSINFAKYLMVEISANLRYDARIDSRIRIQEGISLGVTYTYTRAEDKNGE